MSSRASRSAGICTGWWIRPLRGRPSAREVHVTPTGAGAPHPAPQTQDRRNRGRITRRTRVHGLRRPELLVADSGCAAEHAQRFLSLLSVTSTWRRRKGRALKGVAPRPPAGFEHSCSRITHAELHGTPSGRLGNHPAPTWWTQRAPARESPRWHAETHGPGAGRRAFGSLFMPHSSGLRLITFEGDASSQHPVCRSSSQIVEPSAEVGDVAVVEE